MQRGISFSPATFRSFSAWASALAVAFTLPIPSAHAQVTYNGVVGAGTESTVVSGLTSPSGIAFDASGNVFVASNITVGDPPDQIVQSRITKETLSSGSYTGSSFEGVGGSSPIYLGVGGNGYVYAASVNFSRVYIFKPSGSLLTFFNTSGRPAGIAVDASENLYLCLGTTIVKATNSNNSYSQAAVITGLTTPTGVAVDANGNLYVVDNGAGAVYLETYSGGTYTQSTIANITANGIALDANGDVLLTQSALGTVLKESYVNGAWTQTTLPGTYTTPSEIAVDGSGNVFVTDSGTGTVDEITPSANVNFGSQAVGSASATQSLSFNVAAGTIVGSVSVLTTGVANKDFYDAGASTCTAQTYDSATTCVVNVALNPHAPGLRRGAVVINDGSGNPLANLPIYGTGTGPQIAYANSSPVTIFSSGSELALQGLATDGAGNVYAAAQQCPCIEKIAPGGATTQLGTGLDQPLSVAVDGAGDVFIGDAGNNEDGTIYEINTAGTQTALSLSLPLAQPTGLVTDGAGNLYIADNGNQAIYKLTPSGVETTIASNLGNVQGLAVDSSGNLYYASNVFDPQTAGSDGTVYQYTPQGNVNIVAAASTGINGIAVDPAGNLYEVILYGQVLAVQYAGGGINLLDTSASGAIGLALDNSGNLYFSTGYGTAIGELHADLPPSLNFGSTNAGTTSQTSPLTTSITNIGNEPLTIGSVSYPADFPEDPFGDTTDCAAGSLSSGASCTFTFDFIPNAVGGSAASVNLAESLKFTSNNLNVTGSTQRIALSGTDNKQVSAIALTGPSSPVLGSGYLVTATVTGSSTPTGTVNLYSAGVLLAALPLDTTGSATYAPNLTAGTHTLTATYSGDGTFTAATTTSGLKITVVKPTLTISLSASSTSPTIGSGYSVTATLAGSLSTPAAQVKFYSGGILLGTVTPVSGFATFYPTLTGGSHSITATYVGDGTYSPTTSSAITINVLKSSTTVTLSSSANPASNGAAVTFTATLTTANGQSAPTGTVKFYSGGALIGSGTIGAGEATLSTSSLTPGVHTITATYAGDTNYNTASAPSLKQTVNK